MKNKYQDTSCLLGRLLKDRLSNIVLGTSRNFVNILCRLKDHCIDYNPAGNLNK